MKLIIQYIFIGIFTFAFCQENIWHSPTSTFWNSFFHQMTFREPIIFTPYEFKYGIVYNQGTVYWSENQSKYFAHNMGRILKFDLVRTNLPHLVFQQNYIDLQMGFGIQYINFSNNLNSISELLPDSLGELENVIDQHRYYFSPKSIGLDIHTSLSWQFFPKRITYLYYSMAYNKLTFYQSDLGSSYLSGNGISNTVGIGTKFLFKNSNNNYRFYWGLEGKINTISVTTSSDPKNISSITSLDLDGFTFYLTTGIQFGGKRSDGDIAYSYMIKNDFIPAAENFENFLSKEKRHGKREKALKMLQYCVSQIPYQQVNAGKKEMFASDYNEAVEWFAAAETEADDELKIEIQSNRQNIANEIMDSVQNYKNQMAIAEAEKLIMIARELLPENKRADQILAGLYFDKGILNTDIGNYSEALENYFRAIELYPPIEHIVLDKLDQLINAFMKDAFLAAKTGELHLAIHSLKTIIELKPELSMEWDSYIVKLESQLENQNKDSISHFVQNYIENRQQETISDYSHILQLGMTYKEVEKRWGTPDIIDEMNTGNQYYQMWTYKTKIQISRLYFEGNKLVRIEE